MRIVGLNRTQAFEWYHFYGFERPLTQISRSRQYSTLNIIIIITTIIIIIINLLAQIYVSNNIDRHIF